MSYCTAWGARKSRLIVAFFTMLIPFHHCFSLPVAAPAPQQCQLIVTLLWVFTLLSPLHHYYSPCCRICATTFFVDYFTIPIHNGSTLVIASSSATDKSGDCCLISHFVAVDVVQCVDSCYRWPATEHPNRQTVPCSFISTSLRVVITLLPLLSCCAAVAVASATIFGLQKTASKLWPFCSAAMMLFPLPSPASCAPLLQWSLVHCCLSFVISYYSCRCCC